MKVVDKKVPVMCCGAKMEELVPNTEDAAGEKHVPVITKIDECRVKVKSEALLTQCCQNIISHLFM